MNIVPLIFQRTSLVWLPKLDFGNLYCAHKQTLAD